ncbi:MAG: L,D-transpeptidase family protein [Mariprofundales bacterium]
MKISRLFLIVIIFIAFIALLLFYIYGRGLWVPVYKNFSGKDTIDSVIEKYGQQAEDRLKPYFEEAGIIYPPKSIKLLAIKDESNIELWASNDSGYKKIKVFKIQAASGSSGPKLIEGDKQVPEGFYKIIGFNPNSSYHLSMKLNYPNEFDLEQANKQGRTNIGSNIFIHGKAVSIGCLAMGDRVIEELFTLVYRVGIENSEVIISPSDPRKKPILISNKLKQPWIPELYQAITIEFIKYYNEK